MRIMRSDRLTRIGAVGVFFLYGCSSLARAPGSTPALAQPTSSLVVVVASDQFATGTPRVPFVLFDGDRPFSEAQSVQVTAYMLDSATATPMWMGEATSYNDYEIPYWVVYPELARPGYWGIETRINLSDGTTTSGEFAIEVVDDTGSPDVGDRAIASHNRTLASEPDIRKLSSDSKPDLALYQTTLADALESGLPTVVTFATPGYCVSRLCAPVLNSVKAAANALEGEAVFVHIEVYKTFDPLVYADEMREWSLMSEPWTFVIDRQATITARLGGPVSLQELTQALEPDLIR